MNSSPNSTVFPGGATNPFATPTATRTTGRDRSELESPRLRSHAMALSRSQDSFTSQAKQNQQDVVARDRALQRSPTRRSLSLEDENALSHSQHSLSLSRSHSQSRVPLLMPPPPLQPQNRSGLWRFVLRLVALDNFVHSHSEMTILVARWALFVGKMAYLAQPCAPYLPASRVVLPLVGLAGLDMVLPFSSELAHRNADLVLRGQTPRVMWKPTTEVIFLVIHLFVAWWATRAGVLCMAPFAI